MLILNFGRLEGRLFEGGAYSRGGGALIRTFTAVTEQFFVITQPNLNTRGISDSENSVQ